MVEDSGGEVKYGVQTDTWVDGKTGSHLSEPHQEGETWFQQEGLVSKGPCYHALVQLIRPTL